MIEEGLNAANEPFAEPPNQRRKENSQLAFLESLTQR